MFFDKKCPCLPWILFSKKRVFSFNGRIMFNNIVRILAKWQMICIRSAKFLFVLVVIIAGASPRAGVSFIKTSLTSDKHNRRCWLDQVVSKLLEAFNKKPFDYNDWQPRRVTCMMAFLSNVETVEESEPDYDESDCVDLLCCCMVRII